MHQPPPAHSAHHAAPLQQCLSPPAILVIGAGRAAPAAAVRRSRRQHPAGQGSPGGAAPPVPGLPQLPALAGARRGDTCKQWRGGVQRECSRHAAARTGRAGSHQGASKQSQAAAGLPADDDCCQGGGQAHRCLDIHLCSREGRQEAMQTFEMCLSIARSMLAAPRW